VYLKGRPMSKNRLVSGAAIVAVIAASLLAMTVTASAKPAKQNAPIKLGFITKFPVDFYFLLVNASK
jgi:ABC-type sugar transport system substrate-binding protein